MSKKTTRRVRAVAGLLSVLTLLGMMVADFLISGLHLTDRFILILTAMISAFLGVDIMVQNKGRIARAIVAGIDAYLRGGKK